jgi:hypothetical protein
MALDLSSDNDNDSSNDEEDTDEYSSTYSTNSSIATNTFNDIETCVCDENGNRRSARIVYKMIQSTATCDKSTSTEEDKEDNSEGVGQTFSSNSDKQDEELSKESSLMTIFRLTTVQATLEAKLKSVKQKYTAMNPMIPI